jgi:hypothetical protein
MLVSLFQKACPHCHASVDVRSLRKVPRKTGRLKWYQFTPAPHTACPDCRRFVVSTFANSLLLAVPFGIFVAALLAAMIFPRVGAILHATPGEPYSLAVLLLVFVGAAQRKAVLLPEVAPAKAKDAL